MENGRVALVSGANRGIGREIGQLTGMEVTAILGSRDEERGRAAGEGLSSNVVVRQLDVAEGKSVDRPARSVEEGGDTPLWAATLPNNGPTGGFFRDRRPIPW